MMTGCAVLSALVLWGLQMMTGCAVLSALVLWGLQMMTGCAVLSALVFSQNEDGRTLPNRCTPPRPLSEYKKRLD